MELTDDNLDIHSLWIGEKLSKLELLTLNSFVQNGHRFHLWIYEPIESGFPEGVILDNAEEIIERKFIFRYRNLNQFKQGKGSIAGFSDIFRYKLLFEKGGWWVDMDITCLKPFDIKEPYFFRNHHLTPVVGNVLKCPGNSILMKTCYEESLVHLNENTLNWLKPLEILSENVKKFNLTQYIKSDLSFDDRWEIVSLLRHYRIAIPDHFYFIHWLNEVWRWKNINKELHKFNSVYGDLLRKFGLVKQHISSLRGWLNSIRHFKIKPFVFKIIYQNAALFKLYNNRIASGKS
jgi:hypothetical protein